MNTELPNDYNEHGHALAAPDMGDAPLAGGVAVMLDTPEVGPQIVFPPDTRQRINTTTEYPWSTIGQLWMSFPNGESYTGTGTLIDGKHVLTAAHNLYGKDIGGWAKSVYFMPARNGDDYPYGTVPATKLFITEDYFTLSPPDPNRNGHGVVEDYTLYTQDYAVVRLEKALKLPIMGMVAGSYTQLNGATARITGYPGDKTAGTMWTDSGPLAQPDDHFLFYKINTWRGQSGSGLFVDLAFPEGKSIVGVHVAGDPKLDSNFAVRLTNQEINTVKSWMKMA